MGQSRSHSVPVECPVQLPAKFLLWLVLVIAGCSDTLVAIVRAHIRDCDSIQVTRSASP